MKKHGIILLVIFVPILIVFQYANATKKDYYRTYEIIEINKNGLKLQDSSGNIVITDNGTKGYKVGYKVRYDKIRKRLRFYRWQEFEVIAVSGNEITLQHKTGDTISVMKKYSDDYNIGDRVRYDSVSKILLPGKDSVQ